MDLMPANLYGIDGAEQMKLGGNPRAVRVGVLEGTGKISTWPLS